MMATSQKRVVIVGAGFGGLKAAKGFSEADIQVIVIDRSNHHLFQPLLYQVATATLSPADIATPIRSVLKKQKNAEVILANVDSVDPSTNIVITNGKPIPYDFLILATGARHSYFQHPEWEKFAPGLKSISDATALRRRILLAFEAAEMETSIKEREKYLQFVLVGGGPTGVEMAGAIAELSHKALASDFRKIDPRSAKISLVEAGPRILSSFSPELSQKAEDSLKELGVEVRTSARVENITSEGVTIDGEMLFTRNVYWTAGVVASPAAIWLGAEADPQGRVKVLNDLSVPNSPNVFVIGDTSSSMGENGRPLPGIAPVAMQQGEYVAKLIMSRIDGSDDKTAFKYKDKGNLATIGRSSAIAEIGNLRLSGFAAWLTWALVHIYFLIGFKNRMLVLLEWAWAYLTFQRGARLIIDPQN